MLREHYINNAFFIKKVYKHFNNFDGIDEVFFVLANGEVINVKSLFKDTPDFKKISDLSIKIMVFGGYCSKDNNGIMIGTELKSEGKWRFKCSECENEFYISDNKVDEHIYNSLCLLDGKL